MLTYTIMNTAFLLVAVIVLVVLRKHLKVRALLYTALILLALTATFDAMIVASGIVTYNPSQILGVKILTSPIEDFAYSVAAFMLLPVIWTFLHYHEKRTKK